MSIELQNITFSYFAEGKPTLEGLSVRFEREHITVLTGGSGCGKSTALYLMAGIYPHNTGFLRSGSVFVEGVNPEAAPPPERCRLVGMMFQNPQLQFCMDTAEHELVFCLENQCIPSEEIPSRVDQALSFCDIPHLKHRTLLSLSGGERQKVMLACLVALNPQWILLDEPFANVDERSAKTICQKLRMLHDTKGTGILAVDHRLDHWLDIADELRILENSQVSKPGLSPSAFSPEFLEQQGIIVPNRHYLPQKAVRPAGEPVLCLRNVSLSYGDKTVLRSVNATFDRGRIHAIVGSSGCGKSSLFGALSGVCRYIGQITVNGTDLRKLPRNRRGTLGFVTQNPEDQFISDTVYTEVFDALRKNPNASAETERILRENRLWRYRDVSPYLLSQGQQRRLGVAALMAYDCQILICDEPTYAQDRNNTLTIMNGLIRQTDQRQVCLIFSTHDRKLAEDYADVIWTLEGGTLHANTEPCL